MFDNFYQFDFFNNYESNSNRTYKVWPDHGRSFVNQTMSLSEFEFKSRFRMRQETFTFVASHVIFHCIFSQF